MSLKVVIVVVLAFALSANSQTYFRDYYWRIYDGVIPSDAYEGGQNVNGTTFIGQVLDINLSPVEVRPGHREVYVPNDVPTVRRHLIKVLCSRNRNEFRWYATNSKDLRTLLTQKTLMRGGISREEDPYYIGRVYFRNQLVIGRIRVARGSSADPIMESVYWSGGGYAYHTSEHFDVLVYEDPVDITDRTT